MTKKLYKSRRNIMFDGVCGGLAEYLGLDVTIVRLLWILFGFFGGGGFVLYVVCMFIIPREPEITVEDYNDVRGN